ncbi:uncharacterized protein si:dkey-30e9.6 [Hippoglossus stenolepis]|uniref:uncharacterized protein si:dkey-30e9.6 n=1 Tax=Hippoglossus stenolepis TaxID=195615 RepID=UPI001FB00309|nr:uncharacterized protein si:dkey-30e9.6 [Hippoglossus stenolepis]
MAPCGLLDPLPLVSFESKAQFSASRALSLARSKYFKLPETESRQVDVWSIKPPDFSLKLYRSLSVPQRKERKALTVPAAQQTTRTSGIFLPDVSRESYKRNDRVKFITSHRPPDALESELKFITSHRPRDALESELRFLTSHRPPDALESELRFITSHRPPDALESELRFITSHRPPDALESELKFVRTGKFPSEPYVNPRPHNFRPLDENLPDVVTTYERDPGNLTLRLKHLDTMPTPRCDTRCTLRDTRTKMDTYRPAEPQWDVKLVLPLSPWPPKSASYTRHRRRRGAYSAFIDRVEEKLSRSWKLTS